MNEKLKEAAQSEFDARYPVEWNNYTVARNWAMEAWHNALAAAARGEIPGFRLLDEGAAKDAERYRYWRKAYVNMTDGYEETYDAISISETEDQFDAAIDAAMLTASREEQK